MQRVMVACFFPDVSAGQEDNQWTLKGWNLGRNAAILILIWLPLTSKDKQIKSAAERGKRKSIYMHLYNLDWKVEQTLK